MIDDDILPDLDPAPQPKPRRRVRVWDWLGIYLPVLLMGLLVLGTYWMVRNNPIPEAAAPTAAPPKLHEPDYLMKGFSLRTFAPDGRLKSEISGDVARHFPDTDTLEIDKVRMRGISPANQVSTATAGRALSNGDGTEVQLFDDARVVREAGNDASGRLAPQVQIESDFLHVFMDTERVKTHRPVRITRGGDRFSGDGMAFDNIARTLDLHGQVRGQLAPRGP